MTRTNREVFAVFYVLHGRYSLVPRTVREVLFQYQNVTPEGSTPLAAFIPFQFTLIRNALSQLLQSCMNCRDDTYMNCLFRMAAEISVWN